jgi:hypothetical protein
MQDRVVKNTFLFFLAIALPVFRFSIADASQNSPPDIFVNGIKGNDNAAGDRQHPLKTLSAAIERLPDPLTRPATIEWTGGIEATTGGKNMASNCLELMRRMKPDVHVSIVGHANPDGEFPRMAWEDNTALVDVREGDWRLEKVQIGTATTRQRRGVTVAGPDV